MRNKVSFLLILTLFIVGLSPLFACYVLIDDILLSQQKFYLSQDLSQALVAHEENLKRLSKIEPESKDLYRLQFEKVQNLKLLFGEDEYFSEAIRSTTIKYFFIIFGLALTVSLISGIVLSFKVNQIYIKSFDELVKEREKSRYLSEMAKWQDVAKKLAHEIRRPLQPMRIWLSQLKKGSTVDTAMVKEAATAIDQEVLFLSEMVSGFSDFAQIPKPKLETVELADFIQSFVAQYGDVWATVKFKFQKLIDARVALDPKIFRTLFTNLVENAVEANPDSKIDIDFNLRADDELAYIEIFNSGVTLNEIDREKIFDIYYSTKTNAKNMGLGLAIVKTIVLEHGGDIKCVAADGGVKFEIQLPLVKG
jgi:signal transduction histidine kinase